MKIELSGWAAKVASIVVLFVVAAAYLVGAVIAEMAPYSLLAALVILAVLTAGLYWVTAPRMIDQYPKHVLSWAGMFAGFYMVAFSTAGTDTGLVRQAMLPVGLVLLFACMIWHDVLLPDVDSGGFEMSIFEGAEK